MRHWSGLLVLLLLAHIAPAQELTLGWKPVVGQDVLVEVKRTFKGTMTIKAPQGDVAENIDVTEEMAAVDKVLELKEGEIQGSRLYLKTYSTENGVISDSERGGLEFEYKLSGGLMSLAFPLNDQLATAERNKKERCRRGSLTTFLNLPETWKTGEVHKIDLGGIFPDLSGADDLPRKAIAELKLVRVDDKKKTARLEGPFKASVARNDSLEIMPAEFDGTCELVLDLKGKRVQSVNLTAKMVIETDVSGMACRAAVDMTAELKAVAGKKATAARKKKAKFRPVPRQIKEIGLGLTMSSCFYYAGENVSLGKDVRGFVTGVNGVKRLCRFGFRRIPSQGNTTDEVSQSIDVLKKQFPKGQFTRCKTGAGAGQTMTLERNGYVIMQDFIAAKGAVLIVIHSFPVADKKTGMAEVKLVRKSLSFSGAE